MHITKEEAEGLFAEVCDELNAVFDALSRVGERISQIIKTEAWLVLGYKTFHEAWLERMKNVRLNWDFLPQVVYQMLEEGATTEDITFAVNGVTPFQVESLAKQRESNVPASSARRRHSQQHKPRASTTIFVHVTPAEMREWSGIARRWETTVDAIAREAVEERFREMSREEGAA